MNVPTQQAPLGASGAHEAQSDAGPACPDSEARARLVPYALSTLSDEEAIAFEAHLLLCPTCFEDLKVLDRAGVVLREFTQGHPLALDRVLAEHRRRNV